MRHAHDEGNGKICCTDGLLKAGNKKKVWWGQGVDSHFPVMRHFAGIRRKKEESAVDHPVLQMKEQALGYSDSLNRL